MQDQDAYERKRDAAQYHQMFAQAQGPRLPQDMSGPRPQPAPPGPGSPVETALYATAELTGQVERLVDELHGRLSRGGVLVCQLLEHAGYLERLSLQLQTLLQQLAL